MIAVDVEDEKVLEVFDSNARGIAIITYRLDDLANDLFGLSFFTQLLGADHGNYAMYARQEDLLMRVEVGGFDLTN